MHDARELLRSSEHPPRRHVAHVDADAAHAGDLLEHELVEVDLGEVGDVAVLVDARELEQLRDRLLEAVVLREHALRDDGPVDVVAAPQRDLELRANDGDGTAQLVRRVGHELALPCRGAFEPVEHRVHRLRELPDLVVGARLRNAAVHRRARDRRGLGPDGLDGTQRAAREVPRRAAPTSRTRMGTPMSSASVMLPVVSSTSASERCAMSVTRPAGELTV